MQINRRTLLAAVVASSSGLLGNRLLAQSSPSQSPQRKPVRTARLTDDSFAKVPETEVMLELLTGGGAASEHAQQWGQQLQKLNVTFQTRQGVSTDKPLVKEQKLGRLRRVTVVAMLDRNGKIVCEDRSFTLAQSQQLAEWVRELKAYGAQGAPQGKPMFGLDESQFRALINGLSPTIEVDTLGLKFDAALSKLPLPSKHPLRMTPEGKRAVKEFDSSKTLRQSVKGLSVGTGLAVVLSEFGLAFKPLRTPEGSIELSVFPREEDSELWPIGWPLDPSRPQGQIAPALFKMVPVELNDVPLTEVLSAASNASEIPILLDHFPIDQQEIDLSELKVTVPARKTTWGLLLKQITFTHKLGRRIVTDEAGRPLVLITTLKDSLKETTVGKPTK